ncbi:GntR family transcriptional regulator [Pseudonocardia sp. GCM10023141]|uniref:GntR family transcriptional regulator n=1 Tax=Pseudonocardia sp. GCM10023141 TaxID=3252653 RepID=UPI00361652F9
MAPSLHLTLAAELRRRIRSGALGIGEPVPSEAQLCREFGSSRGPVRQALAALREEGLIGGGQGRRAVVLDAVESQPFETFVSFSRWAQAIGRAPGQHTQEIALRRPEPAVAAALHLDADTPAVQLLRLRLLDGEPAMVERSTFVAAVGRALLDADLDTGSIYEFLTGRGVDLHTARHTLDAIAADAVDAALLGVPEGAPLLRERRLTTDATGAPLEWSDDRYRSDIATVTITNTRRSRAAMTRTGT